MGSGIPDDKGDKYVSAGYKVHLIFIGMSSIAECIQRVAVRVKTGGHKVFEESIVYNFEHGYHQVKKLVELNKEKGAS